MKKNTMFLGILSFFLLLVTLLFTNNNYFQYLFVFIWAIATVMIIYGGFYFSFKYKFLQLNFKAIIGSLKNSNKAKNEINSFEALSMSMAEKIGVGSLSGIALAIYFGGVGTIFWISIFTIICSINSYVEAVLGIKYQEKENNTLIGGPSFYIKNKLKDKKLAKLYALLIIISYSGIFIAIQANTIVKSIGYTFNININVIVLILLVSVIIVIFNKIKKIAKFTAILVPFMVTFYLLIGLFVIINNLESLPKIFSYILQEAFSLKAGLSSFFYTLVIGLQRAAFATEAGIGTTAIASALTDTNPHKYFQSI